MPFFPFPRLAIAGLSGGGGKTLVSLALAVTARRAGLAVRTFKKGPDYIDAAWLAWASGHPTRNLDSWLMGFPKAVESFARTACAEGLNVIEGNRGLYDGVDARGTHSTAALAKALDAPVILVVDATKATRTVAASVLGCQKLDAEVKIAGVVLNRAGGARHQALIREAVEADCGIPVLGAIPKLAGENLLPERHLGLVTPAEHQNAGLENRLLELVAPHLDVEGLLEISANAGGLAASEARRRQDRQRYLIGYLKDSVFTFYYPENLEALEAAGANLLPIDSLRATELPAGIDALYIGGGFPETHAQTLSGNRSLLQSLKQRATAGLPVYAECGGLMLLSRAMHIDGRTYPMAGVLPCEVELCPRPQGHGYVELHIERENPFFSTGLSIKGHEFHYSRIVNADSMPRPVCSVSRGTGCGGGDAIVSGNVWASYTHIHALATPEWAAGLMAAARRHASILV
ncbi:MAG TPA: cobyrinate a,c-diamide synthase [Bryobacteraceae bacterium]|nr:cobyrinate a,c-diamide synthase [Bryobacteraceae bacterium]